ncbi:MAG: hypothetical protein VYE64_08465 [Planctomycetota bacterium]|nr:hypothetical protein [Planctomycetota bacterium]
MIKIWASQAAFWDGMGGIFADGLEQTMILANENLISSYQQLNVLGWQPWQIRCPRLPAS